MDASECQVPDTPCSGPPFWGSKTYPKVVQKGPFSLREPLRARATVFVQIQHLPPGGSIPTGVPRPRTHDQDPCLGVLKGGTPFERPSNEVPEGLKTPVWGPKAPCLGVQQGVGPLLYSQTRGLGSQV